MKTKKRLSTFGLIIAILMMTMTFFQPFVVLADDNESQTGDGGDGGNAGKVSGTWCTDSPGTGTRYTIKIDGQEIVLDLDAGQTIAGSENAKGYQTTGYDNLDDHGSSFDLPEDKLILEREDWAAIATAAGEPEIAEKILDSSSSFDGFVEQYLWCGHQDYMWNSSSGWNWRKRTATELKALQNNSNAPGRVSSIGKCIETSYNAFREESDLYDDYMGLKGYNTEDGQGWGGYKYEPEEVPPPPPPPPPPPEEEEPEEPEYIITPGDAGNGGSYDAQAVIDDDGTRYYVDVIGGGPIPTTDGLVVTGKTSLGGVVENYGYYQVDFTKATYYYSTHSAVTYDEFVGYQFGYWSGDDPETMVYIEDYKLDENGDKIPMYSTKTIYGDDHDVSKEIEGTLYFYIVDEDTKVYATRSATVKNDTLSPDVEFPVNINMTFTKTTPGGVTSDLNSRVVRKTIYDGWHTADIGIASREEAEAVLAQKDAEAWNDANDFVLNANISNVWETKSDTLMYHSSYGSGVLDYNGPIETSYYNFAPQTRIVPAALANNSLGSGYESSCDHYLEEVAISGGSSSGATKTGYDFDANSVRVHTPIYNRMEITSNSNNQLKNTSLATGKIVTLEDSFTVKIYTKGVVEYYGDIETNDYISAKSISCQVCGATVNAYTHTCTVPTTKVDNDTYSIVGTVTAKNGPGTTGTGNNNIPDGEGTIKKTDSIYVAGKIYDMQVRTTNDTGWKLSEAQGLSQLPIGEKGDNGNKIYKYAIKLGYRAYFDFKTLGVANKAVDITPKLYYVDANGNVNNDVEFYFKTGPTVYEKLGASDIFLNMTINSTNGEVNNSDFLKEKAITTQNKGGVDFSKVLNIGKLGKITLTEENALHTTGPANELRWYAEVYIPASLVVAPTGTKLVDVANGKGIMKTGYVIVTFADVTTKLADGRDYLQYSMVRNYLGSIIDFTNSIMYKEKAESGMFKNTINLSNGKTFSGYAETEIPVIVYDISMRANNDYETEGTH